MPIPGDNPIRRSDEDVIGRTAIARAFAEQVIALDVSQGAVVGVLGPWGHGKTSFVNLARERFAAAGVEVLDFNPWMFSGAEQLVESFFIELAAQLRLRPGLAEIAADFASYGDAFSGLGWLPVAGPWIERARGGAKAVTKLLERRKEGVSDRRARLIAELTTLERAIGRRARRHRSPDDSRDPRHLQARQAHGQLPQHRLCAGLRSRPR